MQVNQMVNNSDSDSDRKEKLWPILGNINGVNKYQDYDTLKGINEELEKTNKRLKKKLDKQEKKILRFIKEREILLEKITELEEFSDESQSDESEVLSGRLIKKDLSMSPPPTITTIPRKKSSGQTRTRKISSKPVRRVQPIQLGEDGKVKLPVQIGILTLVSLGEIVHDRKEFHNERYIWPVGYRVQRYYASTVDTQNQTCYTCYITDAGTGPKFHIEAVDRPNSPIIANTATGAWTTVVRLSNAIRRRDHSNSASGPDYFGFSHPTIAKLIQDLANADKCNRYIWQDFEIMDSKSTGVNKRYNVPNLQDFDDTSNPESLDDFISE